MSSLHDDLCVLLKTTVNESTRMWYTARNWLFGLGPVTCPLGTKFDFMQGAALLEKSSHPDALWITKLLYKNGENGQKADLGIACRAIFAKWLEPELHDPRALIYSYLLSPHAWTGQDPDRVFARAFNMGNGLAVTYSSMPDLEKIRQAALQDEPFGWLWLAKLMSKDTNLEFVDACWRRAAEMNVLEAQLKLLESRSEMSSYWLGRLTAQGHGESRRKLLAVSATMVWEYEHPTFRDNYATAIYSLGQTLKSTIFSGYAFNYSSDSESKSVANNIGAMSTCVLMYDTWCHLTRQAIYTWCMAVIRLKKLPRDIRKMIGLLIWKTRSEALHRINTNGKLIIPIKTKAKKRGRIKNKLRGW